jgi:hypothetical protein
MMSKSSYAYFELVDRGQIAKWWLILVVSEQVGGDEEGQSMVPPPRQRHRMFLLRRPSRPLLAPHRKKLGQLNQHTMPKCWVETLATCASAVLTPVDTYLAGLEPFANAMGVRVVFYPSA